MGISLWQLLIILLIVVVLFGTKKLRSVGSDLGGAVKGFRNSMQDDNGDKSAKTEDDPENKESNRVIEGEVSKEEKDKV